MIRAATTYAADMNAARSVGPCPVPAELHVGSRTWPAGKPLLTGQSVQPVAPIVPQTRLRGSETALEASSGLSKQKKLVD